MTRPLGSEPRPPTQRSRGPPFEVMPESKTKDDYQRERRRVIPTTYDTTGHRPILRKQFPRLDNPRFSLASLFKRDNLPTLLKWMKRSGAFAKKGISWDEKPPRFLYSSQTGHLKQLLDLVCEPVPRSLSAFYITSLFPPIPFTHFRIHCLPLFLLCLVGRSIPPIKPLG